MADEIRKSVARSDTPRLTFSVEVQPVTYGDKRTFQEFRVWMRLAGRPVGVVDGPSREHTDAAAATAAAERRIADLRRRPLYVIDVTPADIDEGDAHSCSACAIALALNRNVDRMGIGPDTRYYRHDDYHFEVAPYAAFTDAFGIRLCSPLTSKPDRDTGSQLMPDLVMPGKNGPHTEGMYEWASYFDEWADFQSMDAESFRETYDREDDGEPWKPDPGSFVLDLTTLRVRNAFAAT